jgi:hypothetical protein
MRTFKFLLVLVTVILSGFSIESQRSESGVVLPMKIEGVIITNPSAGQTICTPTGAPYPTIAHSRTGWLQGHQTHGGKINPELSTWLLSSCSTDFATKINTSQIEGVITVANGDSYTYTCIMMVNLITNDVILNITATGGVGIFEGISGQMTLTGIHTDKGIPVSGEGYLSFTK